MRRANGEGKENVDQQLFRWGRKREKRGNKEIIVEKQNAVLQ